MRITTIIAIIAIVAGVGAVTSLIPIHQVSAQAQGPPFTPPGPPPYTPPASQAQNACTQTSNPPFC
jgi:hypothetical protein